MIEKISERYLGEALRLRKEYVNFIKVLDEKSPTLKSYRDELEKIKKRILDVNVHDNKIQAEEKIFKELELVDEKLVFIQKELQPVYDGIEELQSESDKLYEAIIQKYPKMKPEYIKEQLWNKVKHILI